MKRPKFRECPFQVGDIVRSRPGKTIGNGRCMTITQLMAIPDLKRGSYGDDVKKMPVWMFGRYVDGTPYSSKDTEPSEYPGAIWVGFMELDPFLGAAKRAIEDANLREH